MSNETSSSKLLLSPYELKMPLTEQWASSSEQFAHSPMSPAELPACRSCFRFLFQLVRNEIISRNSLLVTLLGCLDVVTYLMQYVYTVKSPTTLITSVKFTYLKIFNWISSCGLPEQWFSANFAYYRTAALKCSTTVRSSAENIRWDDDFLQSFFHLPMFLIAAKT
jgi:hypothetical protein